MSSSGQMTTGSNSAFTSLSSKLAESKSAMKAKKDAPKASLYKTSQYVQNALKQEKLQPYILSQFRDRGKWKEVFGDVEMPSIISTKASQLSKSQTSLEAKSQKTYDTIYPRLCSEMSKLDPNERSFLASQFERLVQGGFGTTGVNGSRASDLPQTKKSRKRRAESTADPTGSRQPTMPTTMATEEQNAKRNARKSDISTMKDTMASVSRANGDTGSKGFSDPAHPTSISNKAAKKELRNRSKVSRGLSIDPPTEPTEGQMRVAARKEERRRQLQPQMTVSETGESIPVISKTQARKRARMAREGTLEKVNDTSPQTLTLQAATQNAKDILRKEMELTNWDPSNWGKTADGADVISVTDVNDVEGTVAQLTVTRDENKTTIVSRATSGVSFGKGPGGVDIQAIMEGTVFDKESTASRLPPQTWTSGAQTSANFAPGLGFGNSAAPSNSLMSTQTRNGIWQKGLQKFIDSRENPATGTMMDNITGQPREPTFLGKLPGLGGTPSRSSVQTAY